MATIQELEVRKAKFINALDNILLGTNVTKGDIDGLGNAEFQVVSPDAIRKEIALIDLQIKRLKGARTRCSGTPRIGGL
tara:strand:- start:10783 stop:11019 length:237 start_codon:yes stop_codon:yes gene_type:complete